MHIAYIANIRLPTEKAHGYQIMKMCEALADAGHSVTLYCPRRTQTNPTLFGDVDAFAYYGVQRIFSVRYLHNWDVMRLERFVPNMLFPFFFCIHSAIWGFYALLVARRGVDIIYLRDDVPAGIIAAMLGIPFVYEVHRISRGLARHALPYIQGTSLVGVIALTGHMHKRLVSEYGFASEKVITLPDGVDMSCFHDDIPRDVIRKKLGISAQSPLIGYVGTLAALGYEKGVDVLIAAVALARAQYPDIALVCVGGPEERISYYRDVAVARGIEGAVYFIGHVGPRHAVEWMRACDALAIPLPYNEFFAYQTSPLKLFEYMASGVPIIASDLPSIREIVDERTATFAIPNDYNSLANAIIAVVQDFPAAETRARAALADVERHSWKNRALNMEQFLHYEK